jgi:hypothetical protein
VTPRQISALAEILLANEVDLARAKKSGNAARVAVKVRPVAAALRPVLPRRVVDAIRLLGLG